MPNPLVPDSLWLIMEPLLPCPPARPKGGRPPVTARAALTGILFVLRTGIPWEMLPAEMGCGSGITCWRRLRDWQAAGVWDRLHRELLRRLHDADRRGIPLGFLLTGANVHDSTPFEALIDAVPPIPGKRGRPRRRPNKLHADKAYDHRRCRDACRRRKIRPRIARRGVDTSQKLGRHRWVIERTFAWFNKLRRLTIRYERRLDIHHAFTSIACSLICLNALLGRF